MKFFENQKIKNDNVEFEIVGAGSVETESSPYIKLENMIRSCSAELKEGSLNNLSGLILKAIVENGEFRKKYVEEIRICGSNKIKIEELQEKMKKEIESKGMRALMSKGN